VPRRDARFARHSRPTSGGCEIQAEATDGLVPPDDTSGDDDGGGAKSGSGTSGATKPAGKTPAPTGDGGSVSEGAILFNEISAESDWVEIVNAGTASVDLSGWEVADLDKKTSGPKLAEGALFAPGTTLAPGAYGVAQGGGADGGKPCPSGGQTFCVHAEFGVSKAGETMFLTGSDGGILGQLDYPANAASGTDTWGRIPSADPHGNFEVTTGTPGGPNEAK
jgi:hypothetical protein